MRAFLSQVELVYVTTLEDKALTLFQGTSQTSKSQKNPYTILFTSLDRFFKRRDIEKIVSVKKCKELA